MRNNRRRKRRANLEDEESSSCSTAKKTKSSDDDRLVASSFRLLNEKFYVTKSFEMQKILEQNPELLDLYIMGFKKQAEQWPVKPVEEIIKILMKSDPNLEVADMGCGEAMIAKQVKQKVHSFDFIALDPIITACDISHVPLPNTSMDVVIFCLSLMGPNIHEFFIEASRILKLGGHIYIAEVESRIVSIPQFIRSIKTFGLGLVSHRELSSYFHFFDFVKLSDQPNKDLVEIFLKPCFYKKR
ncbi:Ribosomal RNA-processing protein 8 [Thelohanellus kitauei]|uniref:Ribosomal RNA-processing protein 8 n=1 Tax=Thelohanellus kitauei TaxID=669202 RepID=A0A0C2MK53_THEKT|nr:Ribosomal RNA-processing protein 8 [Thelohanellus kitauei]